MSHRNELPNAERWILTKIERDDFDPCPVAGLILELSGALVLAWHTPDSVAKMPFNLSGVVAAKEVAA